MTQLKFKICVILLAFSLALTVGTVIILRGNEEQLNPQGNTSDTDTTHQLQQSTATLPTFQQPSQTAPATEEGTEETTEVITEPITEATIEDTSEQEATETEANDIGSAIAAIAAEQVGKPYQYGTAGPDSFDTSGLVQYCFKECGISVPRSNSALAEYGYLVEKEDVQPGDAVFFWSGTQGIAEYLGIYIGDGMVVAAMNSSKPVIEFNMNSTYYTEHFVFVRRFY